MTGVRRGGRPARVVDGDLLECRKCGQMLHKTRFYRNKAREDLHQIWCKSCQNEGRRRSIKTGSAVGVKQCSACGVVKPLTQFHRRSKQRDGRDTVCKVCTNARVQRGRDRRRAERADAALDGLWEAPPRRELTGGAPRSVAEFRERVAARDLQREADFAALAANTAAALGR